MDVGVMKDLSEIIKREKITNNILFMLKNISKEVEETALKHGKHLYLLLKLYSGTGFNLELEEPKYIDFTRDQAIKMLLEDILVYSELAKKNDNSVITILSELIKIKIFILNHILFQNDAAA